MSQTINHCRLCKEVIWKRDDAVVKYGVRHYAHHACYLKAGKSLDDLHPWQVGLFPYRLLQEFGLMEKAEKILAAEKASHENNG